MMLVMDDEDALRRRRSEIDGWAAALGLASQLMRAGAGHWSEAAFQVETQSVAHYEDKARDAMREAINVLDVISKNRDPERCAAEQRAFEAGAAKRRMSARIAVMCEAIAAHERGRAARPAEPKAVP